MEARRRGRPVRQPNPPAAVHAEPAGPDPPPAAAVANNQHTLDEFMRQNPQRFSEAEDPQDAETWISSMEKIFRAINCTDQQKVQWATYRLEGDADRWWESIRRMNELEEADDLTWVEFKEMFLDQYFPETEKDRMADEFLHIRQGDQETVTQYLKRFDRYSRFAPETIPTQAKRTKRFKEGLRTNIRRYVIGQEHETFQAAVNCAREIERDYLKCAELRAAQGQDKKRKTDEQQQVTEVIKKGKADTGASGSKQRVKCSTCGKYHAGECRFGTSACLRCGVKGHQAHECYSTTMLHPPPQKVQKANEDRSCFNCGEVGHFARNCPKPQKQKQGGPPQQQQRAPARAYAMVPDEEEPGNVIM